MPPERIGILGGSFDPVHRGHVRLARYARNRLRLDRVLLIPTWRTPGKRTVAPARHRWKMLRLALRGERGMEPCDMELRRRGISYTYRTLELLRERFPSAKFFLLMGEEAAARLASWRRPRTIASLATVVVFRRGEKRARLPRLPGTRYLFLSNRRLAVSSTEVRRRLAEGKGVGHLLHPAVLRYTMKHSLYASH